MTSIEKFISTCVLGVPKRLEEITISLLDFSNEIIATIPFIKLLECYKSKVLDEIIELSKNNYHEKNTSKNIEGSYDIKIKIIDLRQHRQNNFLPNSKIEFTYTIVDADNYNTTPFDKIKTYQNQLDFRNAESPKLKVTEITPITFNSNLLIMDSCLPQLLGDCLLYSFYRNINNFEDIADMLSLDNTFNISTDGKDSFYKYKLKQFLLTIAFGMNPNLPWNCRSLVNGGIIIIDKNGAPNYFHHFYDQNSLGNFLFKNLYFKTDNVQHHERISQPSSYGVDDELTLNLLLNFKP